jgi:predicted ATP-dependent protease
MANAHRGILYIDDINLVDDDLVTMMLQVNQNIHACQYKYLENFPSVLPGWLSV